MTDDEIVKSTTMTPAQQRMANARAARAAKAAAAPQEQVTRQAKKEPIVKDVAPARTQAQTGSRTKADGRLEVVGHNGEVLSRTRIQVGDQFEIPAHLIPEGWSMQWNAISVAGNAEILMDQQHHMYLNGWRPVPAERYAGTLVPKGTKGNIIRGQQILMERPKALTDEARAEDVRNAHQLIADRNESLKLAGMKKSMAPGFEMGGQYKGTGGDIRMSIDKGLDIPAPSHQLADPE